LTPSTRHCSWQLAQPDVSTPVDYLKDERKKKESTGRGEKRKAIDDEIEE